MVVVVEKRDMIRYDPRSQLVVASTTPGGQDEPWMTAAAAVVPSSRKKPQKEANEQMGKPLFPSRPIKQVEVDVWARVRDASARAHVEE